LVAYPGREWDGDGRERGMASLTLLSSTECGIYDA